MTPADTAFVSQFPGQFPGQLPALAFAFTLVLARCAGAVALLPGFAEAGVPMMIRAGIALCLAILLTPVVAPSVPLQPTGIPAYAGALAAELLVGLWLGFLARLLMLALPVAGQMLAGLLGQSNIIQPDPNLGPQTAALSQVLGVAAAALVFASGLYALPVAALAGSYRLIAPGALLPPGAGAQAIAQAVGRSFALAVRLAAPGLLLSVVWSLGTGIAARLAPRLQVHFLGLPGQILLGLALLSGLTAALLSTWQDAAGSAFAQLPGLH